MGNSTSVIIHVPATISETTMSQSPPQETEGNSQSIQGDKDQPVLTHGIASCVSSVRIHLATFKGGERMRRIEDGRCHTHYDPSHHVLSDNLTLRIIVIPLATLDCCEDVMRLSLVSRLKSTSQRSSVASSLRCRGCLADSRV